MGLDPVSAAAGGLQTLVGLGQTIFSGRKKAEKALNNQINNTPKVSANKGIMDYYNNALSRYNVSATDSALYKRSMGDIRSGQASALAGLQDRRSGLAGTSSILRAGQRAALDANVAAEQQKNQRFNELGNAANMQNQEEKYVFNQNEMLPFDLKTQMASQKLQGANQRANAGMQNIFGGLQTFASSFNKGDGGSNNSVSGGIQTPQYNSFSSLQGGMRPNYSLAGQSVGSPYDNRTIPGLSNYLNRPR